MTLDEQINKTCVFSGSCFVFAIFYPLEALITLKGVSFITGTFYYSIQKRVDEYLGDGINFNVSWAQPFRLGLFILFGSVVYLSFFCEKDITYKLGCYGIGISVSYLLYSYSLWKASKT